MRAVDATVITTTFVITALIREKVPEFWRADIVPGPRLLAPVTLASQFHLLTAIVPIWLWSLQVNGAYGDLRRIRSDVLLLRLARAVGAAVLVLLLALFLFDPIVPTSRSFVIGFAGTSVLTLHGARLIALRRSTPTDAKILVCGNTVEALPFIESLKNGNWGVKVAGIVRPDDEEVTSVGGVKVLGTISQLADVVVRENIAQVFMTGRAWDTATLRQVADACVDVGVTFSMDANFLGLAISRAEVHDYGGWSILSFSAVPTAGDALILKRIIDVAGAVAALLVLTPLFAAVACAIKLEDRGPVLFTQERSGLFGRPFRMYKFRSMVVDAEARRAELDQRNELAGPVFKMKRDPRVTRVGAIIRKLSIDELPQFWNVLRGEMSMVGPRPPIPSEVARYERWQMRRLSMRPGLTCIWQVSGRNHVDFDTWMRLDLQYIDEWSLFLDAKLLLRTVPVVLGGRGAA
jgi:exopolysaccharide biosynthesis polyprenyl glycosylphosphotransferase